jgi:hypothetical protein
VSVDTLSIDGRNLEKGQWVEVYAADKNGQPQGNTIYKIQDVANLDLILDLPADAELPAKGKMRRIITYFSQPDYPNPASLDDGVYLAYLDAWQQHTTTIEDPGIREVALNVPDTTTRSKTVWQLKLQLLDDVFFHHLARRTDDADALIARYNTLKADNAIDLTNADWISFIREIWQRFQQKQQKRQVYMNACAKLCSASGSPSLNGSGYNRLENQLYRIEIHEPGPVGKAKFKWSRDNGCIVSEIEKIQVDDGIITIRKSSQDAWSSSKSGQWIEILDEETELKGIPGALVRLISITDTKIKFDPTSIRSAPIPKVPTKVRRWDHTTLREEAIVTRAEWIPIEAGINVRFDIFDDKSYRLFLL